MLNSFFVFICFSLFFAFPLGLFGFSKPCFWRIRSHETLIKSTNNGITIGRMSDNYKIITAASRKAAGAIYLDEDILKLVDNHKFEMTSDKMVATLDTKHIKVFVNILQDKHGSSIILSASQFDMIKKDLNTQGVRSKKPLPKAEIIHDEDVVPTSEWELEALALELELELMEF